MYRFDIFIFILASIIYTTVAPNVPCPPKRSIGDNSQCIEQKSSQDSSSQDDSDEIPNMENQESTAPTTTIQSIGDEINNGDQGDVDFLTTRKSINFRKRRMSMVLKNKRNQGRIVKKSKAVAKTIQWP